MNSKVMVVISSGNGNHNCIDCVMSGSEVMMMRNRSSQRNGDDDS